jgi:peptide/nickel transport system substrate-binding protein
MGAEDQRLSARASHPRSPLRLRPRLTGARFARCSVVMVAAFCILGATGCGGGDDLSSSARGGVVTLLDVGEGVDSLDPGYWYYTEDYIELWQPTQRSLYGWKPRETRPSPDIAAELPRITDGGKTLTIPLRRGVRYSAPLAKRTVSSRDIKYAMERCLRPQVANGYAHVYYSTIVGAARFAAGGAADVAGIETPDDRTLVLRLTRPDGVLATANALALPCTVPVPKDYAQRYDRGKVSAYGRHQVFTGPYMIENDGKGTVTGYAPGRILRLVRNPSWNGRRTGDFRPAYVDRIVIKGGNDVTVASRKILSGSGLLSGNFDAPPPAVLKEALASRPHQVYATTGGSVRFIPLNTRIKPLDNVDVRRAVSAAADRFTLRATRGGAAIGSIATHFLPPGLPGFEEAGAESGPDFDFSRNHRGDLALAKRYMKKAGYTTGKYSGPPLLMVGATGPPDSTTAEAFASQLEQLGFKIKLRLMDSSSNSKFCQVPKAGVAICPNLGWGKDFFDAASMIDPLFNGKNLLPAGNTNFAEVDDPRLNAQIEGAERLTDPAARAAAWANLDREITGRAYVIPWVWDKLISLASKNVKPAISRFTGSWDLTATSLR